METKSYNGGSIDQLSLSSLRSQASSKQELFPIEDSEKGSIHEVYLGSNRYKEPTRYTSKCMLHCTISISIVVAIAALLLSAAVLAIDQVQVKVTSQEIRDLMDQLHSMEQNISVLSTSQDISTSNLGDIHRMLGQISEETQQTAAILFSNITAIQTALTTDIERVNEELSTQILDNVSAISDRVTSLEEGMIEQENRIAETTDRIDDLNTTISSNVSLYEDCFKQTISCTIGAGAQGVTLYWRLCSTDYMPYNIEGYKVTDMQCDYESVYLGFHVSSVLDKRQSTNDPTARCRCNVLSPLITDGSLLPLPNNIGGKCTLVVTQCPVQQQLFH